MTRYPIPQINPNLLMGCHPLGLNERLEGLHPHKIDLDGNFPTLNPPEKPSKRKSVFQRIESQQFLGKEHLRKFLYQQQLDKCKPRTLSNYCLSATTLLKFIESQGKNSLDQLVPNDLEAFIEHEQDRGITPDSIRLRLTCIYAFISYLVEHDVLPMDRFNRKIRIRKIDRLPRAIDPIDVKRLIAVIDNVRDRAMFLVLLRTGMRIGELLQLNAYDVRLDEKKILIWEGEKNHTGRTVCLSDDAMVALGHWFFCRDPKIARLFYSRSRQSMCYTNARELMNKYLKKAGLTGKRYSLHCLRHTFATDLLNAGMRIECLQQLLGHSSIEMTLRYARLSDKTREDEYFKAMTVIEGEMYDGPDTFDCPFPASLEAQELLTAHDQELS